MSKKTPRCKTRTNFEEIQNAIGWKPSGDRTPVTPDCDQRNKIKKFWDRWINYCHCDSGSKHVGWVVYKFIARPEKVKLLVGGVEQCCCCRDTRMGLYGIIIGITISTISFSIF